MYSITGRRYLKKISLHLISCLEFRRSLIKLDLEGISIHLQVEELLIERNLINSIGHDHALLFEVLMPGFND